MGALALFVLPSFAGWMKSGLFNTWTLSNVCTIRPTFSSNFIFQDFLLCLLLIVFSKLPSWFQRVNANRDIGMYLLLTNGFCFVWRNNILNIFPVSLARVDQFATRFLSWNCVIKTDILRRVKDENAKIKLKNVYLFLRAIQIKSLLVYKDPFWAPSVWQFFCMQTPLPPCDRVIFEHPLKAWCLRQSDLIAENRESFEGLLKYSSSKIFARQCNECKRC